VRNISMFFKVIIGVLLAMIKDEYEGSTVSFNGVKEIRG
jgi:hypothetical protein